MTTITALPTPPTRADAANFSTRADAFLTALPTFATETNLVASEINASESAAAASASTASTHAGTASTQAGIATTKAVEAAASATSALNAPGTNATSTTSLTVGTGSKTFTIQTGKAFTIGQAVVIANTANVANYMEGQITAHNSGTGSMTVNVIRTGGSGTLAAWTISLTSLGGGDVTLNGVQTLTNKTITGLLETRSAMAANEIGLSLGNYFTKTITGNTTFTVATVPSSGNASCFLLELTNAGAYTISWWSNIRWAAGTAPVLTASGTDVLGFYTHDAGANWRGFLLAKDSK